MNIDQIIEQCAKECGLPTYLYARIREANVKMDNIRKYPLLWRQFNDRISFGKLDNIRRRTFTFHFLDLLCEGEPDTEIQILPIVNDMESRAYNFLKLLKRSGCELDLASTTLVPTLEKQMDAFLAGVRCDVVITYNTCR